MKMPPGAQELDGSTNDAMGEALRAALKMKALAIKSRDDLIGFIKERRSNPEDMKLIETLLQCSAVAICGVASQMCSEGTDPEELVEKVDFAMAIEKKRPQIFLAHEGKVFPISEKAHFLLYEAFRSVTLLADAKKCPSDRAMMVEGMYPKQESDEGWTDEQRTQIAAHVRAAVTAYDAVCKVAEEYANVGVGTKDYTGCLYKPHEKTE